MGKTGVLCKEKKDLNRCHQAFYFYFLPFFFCLFFLRSLLFSIVLFRAFPLHERGKKNGC